MIDKFAFVVISLMVIFNLTLIVYGTFKGKAYRIVLLILLPLYLVAGLIIYDYYLYFFK